MDRIHVTVAIITRNRASLLEKSLQSIAIQSHLPNEVLVIDNASTDHTKQVSNHMARDIPIRYIKEGKIGVGFARNAALSNCEGDLLAFIDDDAIADKKWLSRIVKTFQQNPAAVGVQGRTKNIYPKNTVATLLQYINQDIPKVRDRDGCVVRSPTMVCTMNFSLRMKSIREAGLCFDTSLSRGEDREFAYQLLRRGFTILYEETAVNYHHWPQTLAGYLRMRWNAGIAKAQLKHKMQISTHDSMTHRWSALKTLKNSSFAMENLTLSQRTLFVFLLFMAKIIIEAGMQYTTYNLKKNHK